VPPPPPLAAQRRAPLAPPGAPRAARPRAVPWPALRLRRAAPPRAAASASSPEPQQQPGGAQPSALAAGAIDYASLYARFITARARRLCRTRRLQRTHARLHAHFWRGRNDTTALQLATAARLPRVSLTRSVCDLVVFAAWCCVSLLCAACQVAKPYWTDPEEKKEAWLRLGGVVALTLGSTGACDARVCVCVCVCACVCVESVLAAAQLRSHRNPDDAHCCHADAVAFSPPARPSLRASARAGISVGFNYLGRDFFNAISEKARCAPRAR
jgi:hypothetical protein